jgi:two-component system, chemotaxis family, chemotaxis protein CheY
LHCDSVSEKFCFAALMMGGIKGGMVMKKVLIVDDSITVARQLEKMIAESGDFQVVGHAKNGAEGIKLNQTEDPDIICMDMNMPVMDGLAALRSISVLDPKVKVVMITSLGGVGDKFTEAMKLGALNVISKPLEEETVLEILRGL